MIKELIYSKKALNIEHIISILEQEEDNHVAEDSESAINSYYENRKAIIDDIIDDFLNSDVSLIYSELLKLQKKYENLIKKENKQNYNIKEYATKELKNTLKSSVIESTYKLFIEPIKIESINGKTDEVVISTHNDWAKGIIESRFKNIIHYGLEKILGWNVKIKFISR